MVVTATDDAPLAQPHVDGGAKYPLVKHIADGRRVALWMHALYSTEDWACALMKLVMDETGANAIAFLHKRISDTNHAHQIIAAFKQLSWAYPDDSMLQELKKHEHLLATTGHIINLGDYRLETQPPPQHVDKVAQTPDDETPTVVGGWKQVV